MSIVIGKKLKKLFIITSLLFFLLVGKTFADVVEEIDKKIDDSQKQLEELAEQKEAYMAAIKATQENVNSLANESTLLNNQILALENDIKSFEIDINKTGLEIKKLGLEIEDKEQQILRQRKTLKSILVTIDRNDNKSTLEIMLENNNISEFLDQVFYTETVQEKIQDLTDKIRADKKFLEQSKIEQTAKKNKLESLKLTLVDKKINLAAENEVKKELLEKTKGEEKRYKKLLGDIVAQREQILGDIEELRQQKSEELEKIRLRQLRPKDSSSALSWYWAQTDPRWGETNIGLSNSQMKNFGCAVASLAMVFKYYGIEVDPGILARQPIFYYDLIKWPAKWRFLDLAVNTAHKGVDWKRVDKELKEGNPIIVFIRADKKNAGHYVVIFSKDEKDYIVNDPMPWDGVSGANMYLSSTREYLGKIYDTTTTVDQMVIYH